MTTAHRLCTVASLAAFGLAVAACTPAGNAPAADTVETRTVVETREIPAAPVIIEREVQAPPIVIETDRREGDTTTVRAGANGLEVETTNR